jgi:hypothetical protein
MAQQGLPDVVIANAGISVGIDTAEREDLDGDARRAETNNARAGGHLPPLPGGMRARQRARWWASPAWPPSAACPGMAPTAPARRRGGLLRKPARWSAAARRRVVTLLPGYVATPLTARNPLFDAVPDAARGLRRPRLRAIEPATATASSPGRWRWPAKVLRLLPNAVYDRLFASGRGRKKRRGE